MPFRPGISLVKISRSRYGEASVDAQIATVRAAPDRIILRAMSAT